jgi:23S rRNA U2552 (ribose-2'-O)-methylase RlmE/FtsJ
MCKDVSDCKCKIDIDENSKHWDKAKRKTNPYELVHMIGTNHLLDEELPPNKSVENFSPLSRAFFKMLEIYDILDIIPEDFKSKSGMIAHLAEGPGGFMEAVYKRRHKEGFADEHFGITLFPKNRNIPGWSQLYRRKTHPLHNPKVHLLTGDLYKTSTIINYAKHFRHNKAFLVTCDGGFDYSKDFNNQERNSWRIIFAEIVAGLLVQKKKGSMVCKMFDLFTHFSLQIIYILSSLYEELYIFKPQTSRPANSEKYLIAKGFRGVSKNIISSMLGVIQRWDELTTVMTPKTPNTTDSYKKIKWVKIVFENIRMSDEFIFCVKQINETLADQQKQYIDLTLDHIKGRGETSWRETQSSLAQTWFAKHCVHTKDDLRMFYHKKKETHRGASRDKQT